MLRELAQQKQLIEMLLETQRQLVAQRDNMAEELDEISGKMTQLRVEIHDDAMEASADSRKRTAPTAYRALSGEGAASPGYRSLSDSDDIVDGFEEVSYRSCSVGEDVAMHGNAPFEQAWRLRVTAVVDYVVTCSSKIHACARHKNATLHPLSTSTSR